jgi:hypothetical protein
VSVTTNVAFVKIVSDLDVDDIAEIIEKALKPVPEFLEVAIEGFMELGDKE